MTSKAHERFHNEVSAAVVRIAKVLEVPISAFYDPSDRASAEIKEVLAIFANLQCPDARQRCLEYLRAEAKRHAMRPLG